MNKIDRLIDSDNLSKEELSYYTKILPIKPNTFLKAQLAYGIKFIVFDKSECVKVLLKLRPIALQDPIEIKEDDEGFYNQSLKFLFIYALLKCQFPTYPLPYINEFTSSFHVELDNAINESIHVKEKFSYLNNQSVRTLSTLLKSINDPGDDQNILEIELDLVHKGCEKLWSLIREINNYRQSGNILPLKQSIVEAEDKVLKSDQDSSWIDEMMLKLAELKQMINNRI